MAAIEIRYDSPMDNKARQLPAARMGRKMIKVVESVALFVIALATLYATGEEIWKMISTREVTLGDLLLEWDPDRAVIVYCSGDGCESSRAR